MYWWFNEIFFLIERSLNFAEQFFAVVQYFVSFAELVSAIYGQNRKNLFRDFCLSGTAYSNMLNTECEKSPTLRAKASLFGFFLVRNFP